MTGKWFEMINLWSEENDIKLNELFNILLNESVVLENDNFTQVDLDIDNDNVVKSLNSISLGKKCIFYISNINQTYKNISDNKFNCFSVNDIDIYPFIKELCIDVFIKTNKKDNISAENVDHNTRVWKYVSCININFEFINSFDINNVKVEFPDYLNISTENKCKANEFLITIPTIETLVSNINTVNQDMEILYNTDTEINVNKKQKVLNKLKKKLEMVKKNLFYDDHTICSKIISLYSNDDNQKKFYLETNEDLVFNKLLELNNTSCFVFSDYKNIVSLENSIKLYGNNRKLSNVYNLGFFNSTLYTLFKTCDIEKIYLNIIKNNVFYKNELKQSISFIINNIVNYKIYINKINSLTILISLILNLSLIMAFNTNQNYYEYYQKYMKYKHKYLETVELTNISYID